MKSSRFHTFLRTHRRTILALVLGLSISTGLAYAVPPTSPYQPGSTLDPSCTPGSTNCTVTLFPDQTGNSGKYLTTDGSNVSWAAVSGGGSTSPAGSSSAIQFNNAGAFGGDANNFSYDTTNNRVFLGSSISNTNFDNTQYGQLNILASSPSGGGGYTYNQQYTGLTGSDDATYGGTYTGTYNNPSYPVTLFGVDIISTFPPNEFEWYEYHCINDHPHGSGDCDSPSETSGSNIPLTGSAQLVSDGITVTFASTTGHTGNEGWTYAITPVTSNNTPAINVVRDDAKPLFIIDQNGNATIGGGIYDSTHSLGTTGQLLSSNGDGTMSWIGASGGGSSRFGVNGEDDTAGEDRSFDLNGSNQFDIYGTSGGVATEFYMDTNNGIEGALYDNNNYEADLNIQSNTNGNASQAVLTSSDYNNDLYSGTLADADNLDQGYAYIPLAGKSGAALFGVDDTNSLGSAVITETNGTLDLFSSTNSYNLNGVTYALPTSQAAGAGYVLTNNGSGVLSWTNIGGGSSGLTLETDGSVNGDQTTLNLVAGTGVTLTDDGSGSVTIDASGGGGITLQTNSTANGSQSLFNLTGSNGTTVNDNGSGTVTITGPIAVNNVYTIYSANLSGQGDTTLGGNVFLGLFAGTSASSASYSNFIGLQSGYQATNAHDSNFLGFSAGQSATGAYQSNFLGTAAGQNATGAVDSNFLGYFAGTAAASSPNSNFFGNNAGTNATNADSSNFFGRFSGHSAAYASNSNFFGIESGDGATNAAYSNFLGGNAGYIATDANNSNFFGQFAGAYSANASNSNFFGYYAGELATSASFSNLFGYQAGQTFTSNNLGSNNIIIGTNISLPDATANAINLGGVLFGTGSYANTTGNPSVAAVTSGKIGIAKVTPAYTLDVGNSSISGIVARFQNSSGTCDINPNSASLSCSSDQTLKKNITDLETNLATSSTTPDDSILSKVLSLRPVTYNWNTENDSDATHAGFIAQDVRTIFPDLVSEDKDTHLLSLNYTGLLPYTIKAIQEMDVKIDSIDFLTTGTTDNPTFIDRLIAWFGDAGNGITKIHTQELCVGATCVTEAQLQHLLQLDQTQSGTPVYTPPAPVVDDPTPVLTVDPTLETPVDSSNPPVHTPIVDPLPIDPTPAPVVAPDPTPADVLTSEISTPDATPAPSVDDHV